MIGIDVQGADAPSVVEGIARAVRLGIPAVFFQPLSP